MWVFFVGVFLWGRETFCKKFPFPTPQLFKNLRVVGEKLFSYNQLRFGVVYIVVVKDNFAVSVGDDFAA